MKLASTSAKTGTAPWAITALGEAMKVTAGTITSSPGPDVEGGEAHPQGGGAGADPHGVRAPGQRAQLGLELLGLVAQAVVAVAEERLRFEDVERRLPLSASPMSAAPRSLGGRVARTGGPPSIASLAAPEVNSLGQVEFLSSL